MSDVDDVKQKVDMVELVGEYVKLTRAGSNYKGLCPFHQEKTPSFMVSPELQIYKCFGCQRSGDHFTFLQEMEGLDFYEALQVLAERAGVELKKRSSAQESGKREILELNDLAARVYHYVLIKQSKGEPFLDYLIHKRGVLHETIEAFQLGAAPGETLLADYLQKKGIELEKAFDAGLLVKFGGRYRDRFSGRVIFPITNARGMVIALAGRLLPGVESRMAKYVNSPETPVYKKSQSLYGFGVTREDIRKSKAAIVVEGELDLLSVWQAGYKNSVAIKGSSVTSGQLGLLSRFADRLILALDADEAGGRATVKALVEAQELGVDILVADLSPHKDPDELARKNPVLFRKRLSQAKEGWEHVIDGIIKKHGVKNGAAKARISRELVPILGSIPDSIVQAHYIDFAARRLEVARHVVTAEVEKRAAPAGPKDDKEEKKSPVSRRERLEQELLAVCLHADPEALLEDSIAALIQTRAYRRIVKEFRNYEGKGISGFRDVLPPELKEAFSEIALLDRQSSELADILREIKILNLKEKLSLVAEKIRSLEDKGDKKALKGAEKEFSVLSEALTEAQEDV